MFVEGSASAKMFIFSLVMQESVEAFECTMLSVLNLSSFFGHRSRNSWKQFRTTKNLMQGPQFPGGETIYDSILK